MKITQADIDRIDLSPEAAFISNPEAKKFFLADKGEHYKLLAYLSMRYTGITISDIGTFRGCSALALAANPKNKVVSYDISNSRTLHAWPENIQFVIYKQPFSADILGSKIIFLDILHEGYQEQLIIDFLIYNKWRGILIMDDIHHFPALNSLWNGIKLPKEDLTEIGHWSGTGIIYFE